MKNLIVSALGLALAFGGTAMAQQQADKPLSAQASDPKKMGWMQGFPPPADKVIRPGDSDFVTFPKLRWTFCNFRQLMPNVAVDNGTEGARTA